MKPWDAAAFEALRNKTIIEVDLTASLDCYEHTLTLKMLSGEIFIIECGANGPCNLQITEE